MFRRLCDAIGAPELVDDPRYADGQTRVAHRSELTEDLEKHLAARSPEEWVELLAEAGVPAGPVLNVEECFDNDQVRTLPVARAQVEHPALGTLRLVGPGVNLERTPSGLRSPAPESGEHTDEILRELGLTDEEIADLRRRELV
jgi:formyl-CoA transferase